MVKGKKDLSVISFLNNTDMDNNLANYSNNYGVKLNSKHQTNKETIQSGTTLKDEKKIITNKLEIVKQNHAKEPEPEPEKKKKITKEDKLLYVNNFLYYNFHKINRYIPVEDIYLEDESSDSEYDDDFYDYQ